MRKRPLIAVLGATGAQGSGLVRAILADPAQRFAVRAIMRSPEGAAGLALKSCGAEVVRAVIDDRASLVEAFSGAYGIFAVAPFPQCLPPDPRPELRPNRAQDEARQRVRNIAKAATTAGVDHVIWSAPQGGAAGTGETDAILADLPVTFLRPSFFWDNLLRFGMGPRRDADGALLFVLPMGERKLPGIAARDVGWCALGAFRHGKSVIGRSIGISGAHLNGAEMASELARVLCEPVQHVTMSFADYAGLGFPAAGDMARLLQDKYEFNAEYCASCSVEQTRELHAGLLDFRDWLMTNVQHVPVRLSIACGDD